VGSELTGVSTWEDPAWRAATVAWAEQELDRLGLAMDGEPEHPHVRPWSTVIRLDVDGGAVWLKSVGTGSAQEPPLAAALAEWAPGRVLTPLAVHPGRRLTLLPDGGSTLRSSGASASAPAWEAMLADYAQLQIDLVPHVPGMFALGVPDAGPARLPTLVSDLLADDDAMLLDRPGGLTTAVRGQIAAERGAFTELCRRLAEGGVPLSLQHDDLHDDNVFGGGPDGHRFFDWGDATVSHPFLSLLVTLRMAARALGVAAGDPLLLRLRDAYLEPWADYGSPADLRKQCDLALRVGPPARALTWRRILLGLHPAERVQWDPYVPGWMAEYLEPGSLDQPATAAT
jgi:hypothetical protein